MKPADAKKIISTAIDREVESYTFYRAISEKVKDPVMKKLFTELSGEEKQHREFLQGMLSKDVTKMHFDAKKDYKVVDTIPSPPLSPDLKPLDGLVLAIKKELEAMQMYTRILRDYRLIWNRSFSLPELGATWKAVTRRDLRIFTSTWHSPKTSGNKVGVCPFIDRR